MQDRGRGSRIEWIDYAKGLCIVLVVMLYATEWAREALGRDGWLHGVVEFAEPFRMPGLFLVSGLLLSRTIGRAWRVYLDRKVVHFAYFYVLWLTIAFALLMPSASGDGGWRDVLGFYLHSYVRPFWWLWFIYLLPVFFIVTRLALRVARPLVWAAAAALFLAEIDSGVKVLDKFAGYYVFFYTGYVAAPWIFRLAEAAAAAPRAALAVLAAWAVGHGYVTAGGPTLEPLAALALSLLGAAAVVAAAALMSGRRAFASLRYCGGNSIVIYLSFFAPALAARAALTRLGVADPDVLALLAMAAGIAGPLLAHRLVRGTPLRFLYERPQWATAGSRAPSPRAGTGARPAA